MPNVPAALLNHAQLAEEVSRALRKVPSDVVRVNYNVGTDSTDDPSIFFRIVLTDEASREDKLLASAKRVSRIISDEIEPYERWGLIPYFSFRSKSEHDALNDPEWV